MDPSALKPNRSKRVDGFAHGNMVADCLCQEFQIPAEKLSWLFQAKSDEVRKFIVGKRATADYLNGRFFDVNDVSMVGANKLPAYCGAPEGPTVDEYFVEKKGIWLQHHDWPCLVMYGGSVFAKRRNLDQKHESYFPIELMRFC